MTITNVFVETQFPPEISYNSKGGPGFSTTVFTSASGREQRNINWSLSRAQYDVAHGIKTKEQMDEVLAFFYAMMGKAYAFRYKDWADFQIVLQQIGVGDGTTQAFQLVKTYSDPLNLQTFVRPIKKPVVSTLSTVLVNNVAVNPLNFALDGTTGILTLANAPLSTQTVVIGYVEYDVPVRFDVDLADIRQDFYQVESWEGVKLVEVKL